MVRRVGIARAVHGPADLKGVKIRLFLSMQVVRFRKLHGSAIGWTINRYNWGPEVQILYPRPVFPGDRRDIANRVSRSRHPLRRTAPLSKRLTGVVHDSKLVGRRRIQDLRRGEEREDAGRERSDRDVEQESEEPDGQDGEDAVAKRLALDEREWNDEHGRDEFVIPVVHRGSGRTYKSFGDMLEACLSGYHPHPLYVVCLLGLQARAGAGALRRRSG